MTAAMTAPAVMIDCHVMYMLISVLFFFYIGVSLSHRCHSFIL
nr:MAG TPA: hypothetical protein [Caudoviricetes sp.]